MTRTIRQNEIHIWYREVVENIDTSCLCPAEVRQASRFVFLRDRRRYLATRVLVREVLSRYASVAPAAWEFTTGEFGKPYVARPHLPVSIYFNVSHTSTVVACAIAAVAEIGVDIEDRIPEDYRELAKQFFAEQEQNWCANAGMEPESRSRFLAIWTLKEAYIKAIGKGMSVPLTSFSIVPDDNGEATPVIRSDEDGPPRRWYCKRLTLPTGLPLAVTVPASESTPAVAIFRYS